MFSGIAARVRSLWSGIRRRDQVDVEIQDEFQHHLELRAADHVRSGLSPDEAARKARIEFGMTEEFAQKARDARGLRSVDRVRFSWLDIKLGFRMLMDVIPLDATLVRGSHGARPARTGRWPLLMGPGIERGEAIRSVEAHDRLVELIA